MKHARRILIVTLLVGGLTIPSAGSAAESWGGRVVVPQYVEETESAGLDHRYDGEFEFFVGGGVATFDCDADGQPDLYFAGGVEPASLFRNQSQIGGALAFEMIAHETTDLTEVVGAYPIDIDGDDIVDLVVMRRGENVLLRGLGDCAFERANEAWGFDGGAEWTTAFSAKWESGAALPTLAVGNYLTIVERRDIPVCEKSLLYRPATDGQTYQRPTALSPGYCTLSMLFSDWDRSGRMDLWVTNDRHYYRDGEEQLWRIEAGQPPRLWTRDEGWKQLRIWGMGIASQDIGGDGYPEFYLTSMADNKLRTLSDGANRPSYTDLAYERGVTAHRPFVGKDLRPSTGWHAEFDDVNNDGRMDIFVSKGNVDAMPDHAARDPNNLLLGKPDGSFVEAAKKAGILDFERSRGAVVADLNLDGLLDLIVVERRSPVRIWRNVGSGDASKPAPLGNWLAIELQQEGPNVDAIGAWIEVRSGGQTMTREVTIGGGHASGQLGPTHIGLGSRNTARVRVIWPDGEMTDWLPTTVNQRVRVKRGEDGHAVLEPSA